MPCAARLLISREPKHSDEGDESVPLGIENEQSSRERVFGNVPQRLLGLGRRHRLIIGRPASAS